MSLMGLSSSTSMGTLVLWIQVLVHRCLSRTYEFLEEERLSFRFTPGGLSLSLGQNRIYFDFLHKYFTIKAFRKSLIIKMFNPCHSLLTFNLKNQEEKENKLQRAWRVSTVVRMSRSSAAWSGRARTARQCRSREPPPPACT